MVTRIIIPQLFENMEEATIGVWLKHEGDAVARGDVLCELITEKSTFELEAEGEGLLRRIVAAEKSVVPVNYVIGLLGEAGDELPEVSAENERLEAAHNAAGETAGAASKSTLSVPSLAKPAPGVANKPPSGGRVRATPAARRLAKELGADLDAIAAANPGKVLSEEDVKGYGR